MGSERRGSREREESRIGGEISRGTEGKCKVWNY